jgi:hypothetical protein
VKALGQYTLEEVNALINTYFPNEDESVLFECKEGFYKLTVYKGNEEEDDEVSVRMFKASSLAKLEKMIQGHLEE